MRQIAILLSLEHVELDLKTGGQFRIRGVDFGYELFAGDERGLFPGGEPAGALFPTGFCRLFEDLLDKPDIGVGVGRGVLRLRFKP